MKADYIIYPANDIRVLSSASRILSSNLMENNKLDVYFNPINYLNFFDTLKESLKIKKIIKETDERLTKAYSTWNRHVFLRLGNIPFKRNALNHIKSDLVLYNANAGELDLETISFLLQNGIRVVAGGATICAISFLKLRILLKEQHECTENHLKNVIFVSGYVTKSTNIHKIIKDWKDVEIGDYHVADFFECTDSYFASHYNIINALCLQNNITFNEGKKHWSNFGGACLFFRSGCWYKKCAFCTYPQYDSCMNIYSSDKSPEYLAYRVIEMLEKHHIKNIFITDDYFVFNDKNRKILRILKDNGVKSATFTGIKLLNNDRYASNMAEYFDAMKIGMESVNDFTLKTVNKGYTRKEITKAMENIKKYTPKSTHISTNVIMDMVSLGEDKILDDYSFLKDMKMDMRQNGYEYFFYNYNILNIPQNTKDRMIDGKLMRVNNEEKSTSGGWRIREILKKGNVHIPRNKWGTFRQDYKRFDINGNELKSDIDIIPLKDMNFLFDRIN